MIRDDKLTTTNGVQIPKLGLSMRLLNDAKAAKSLRKALPLGYRHIATSQAHHNEEGLGLVLRETFDAGTLAREDIILTSKISAEHTTTASAAASIDESLARLGVTYLDAMLVDAPSAKDEDGFESVLAAYRALEEALEAGKVRAIGVTGFGPEAMARFLDACTVAPHINQTLAHIGNLPLDTLRFCRDHGILVEAFAPIGHGEARNIPKVMRMAAKYDVESAQLCLRYALELGMIVLPRAAHRRHLASNLELDFQIAASDMEELTALSAKKNKDWEETFRKLYCETHI